MVSSENNWEPIVYGIRRGYSAMRPMFEVIDPEIDIESWSHSARWCPDKGWRGYYD